MINRKKPLEGLLKRLRKADTGNNSDVCLILKYLEDLLNKLKA